MSDVICFKYDIIMTVLQTTTYNLQNILHYASTDTTEVTSTICKNVWKGILHFPGKLEKKINT